MKKIYLFYIVTSIILAIILIVLSTGNKTAEEAGPVETKKTIDVISVGNLSAGAVVSTTGSVVSNQEAELKSQASGQVVNVNVKVGDKVSKGQILASLNSADSQAQLAQANAAVQIQKAQLAELERKSQNSSYISVVEDQQNTLVDNAYSKLLSEGLIAEPEDDDYTQTPPVISGRYIGQDGTYKVRVHRGSQFYQNRISIFGIETVRDFEINDTAPTKLGTKGLYITFPDRIEDYIDTDWYINIPNRNSSAYASNYSAYLSAKNNTDVVVQQTIVSEEQIKSQKAQVAQAEANVQSVRAQIEKTVIRAPFSGDVVSIPIKVGEYVNVGQDVAAMINVSGIYVQTFMSSDESKLVKIGDLAQIGESTEGSISNVSPGINSSNGKVEVLIVPNNNNESLTVGEMVDVKITTSSEDQDTLLVPLKAVKPKSSGSVVYLVIDGVLKEQVVETGSIVGESVEILNGLTSDSTIALSAKGLEDGQEVEVRNN